MRKEPRFKSITTPGRFFYMAGAIAEFVCLQKYGPDLGPKFWYKSSNKPKARKTFLETQKKIYKLFELNENIKAIDFFPIVFEKISKPKKVKKRKKRMTLKEKKRIDAIKNQQKDVAKKEDQEDKGENLIALKSKRKKSIFGDNYGT